MRREELQIFVYVSIRQHTSAYVSILQHTAAYVSIRQHTAADVSMGQHTSAYCSTRQRTCRSSSNFVAKWLKAIAHKAIAVRVAAAST